MFGASHLLLRPAVTHERDFKNLDSDLKVGGGNLQVTSKPSPKKKENL